jgi:hypothetical protein
MQVLAAEIIASYQSIRFPLNMHPNIEHESLRALLRLSFTLLNQWSFCAGTYCFSRTPKSQQWLAACPLSSHQHALDVSYNGKETENSVPPEQ